MSFDPRPLNQMLEAAAAEGRFALLEHEVYRFLEAAGAEVPRCFLLRPGESPTASRLAELGSAQVMLKIVSPEIAHKTDVGGVVSAPADPAAVAAGAARMLEEVPIRYAHQLEERPDHAPEAYRELSGKALEDAIRRDLRGVLVVERLPLQGDGRSGSELLAALRWNREFGPVITLGVGGIDTELTAEIARKGIAVVSASALLEDEQRLLDLFRPTLAYRRLTGLTRERRPLVEDEAIGRVIRSLQTIARCFGTDDDGVGQNTRQGQGQAYTITELEVNPFGVARGKLWALDGLLQFRARQALPPARPLTSLEPLLRPKSAAVIGVSAKGMNMGRIILRNILESGFDRAHTYVIRPESEEIDGVRCVPTARDLPERVDLLVVVVGAEQVPALMQEVAEHDKAVGVILIPGGMAEKEGGASIEARIKSAIVSGREAGRPLVAVGGNCLGIISRPGRYHTIFIPPSKLPLREDGKSNVAFISQSGAYMISRMSKLDWLSPRYAISTGNQVDLTTSDFLRKLAEDPEVHTFAVYTEGFKDGDGLAFARAVREVVATGRDVIFYKAGRTTEGKSATSGHTASLAGDYDVCADIVETAGAHVAATFADFLALTKVSSLMGGRPWGGRRLAALSNAGYETVGIADSLRGSGWHLELAPLVAGTREALGQALAEDRLDTLVDVRNPLDLTPMATDRAHETTVRAFLAAEEVDLILCATIPLTPAMATLDGDVPEEQSIRNAGSLVERLRRLLPECRKPLVASIDSGAIYDPMTRALEEAGIPTFRSVDEATRIMGLYLEGRLARAPRAR